MKPMSNAREIKTCAKKTVAYRRLTAPTRRRDRRRASFPPSEQAMLCWIEAAARFHTDPAHHAIVALKTVELPTSDDSTAPALYVWEVAWCEVRNAIQWEFVVWDVSGYGVRFRDCASREEAMALYRLPPEQGIAEVNGTPGVHLRAATPQNRL